MNDEHAKLREIVALRLGRAARLSAGGVSDLVLPVGWYGTTTFPDLKDLVDKSLRAFPTWPMYPRASQRLNVTDDVQG